MTKDEISKRAAQEIVKCFIEKGEGITNTELAEIMGCPPRAVDEAMIFDVSCCPLYDEVKCSCGAVKSRKRVGYRYTPSIELLRDYIRANIEHSKTNG